MEGEMELLSGFMRMVPATRSKYLATVALSLLLAIDAANAAERREWVVFTNCQYVTNKDCDGDSFRVRCGTNEFNLRLYFVDVPEPNLVYPERTREQSVYFGVSLDETIKAGARAGEFVRDTLQQPFTVRTRWAMAQGRARQPRYYGFVEVGTNSLAALLVARGWARTKGVPASLPNQKSKDFAEKLRGLEAEARQKRLGVWTNSSSAEKKTEIK